MQSGERVKEKMNRLANEKSAYLQHSSKQKIDWYPWSEEAFERSRNEDKPLFLSSGAVWCHWCHVMAKECFFDDEIARLLNENFISIKLDRDERPSIDRRYQMAVSAMGSGGGWPLSVFLTSDKKPFYGGTYFPPEDKMGRPGLKKVLRAVNDLYRNKREEVAEYSDKVITTIKVQAEGHGDIEEKQLDSAVTTMLSEYDSENGGFGTAPKFPMPGALEFLLNRYSLTQDSSIGHCVEKTLKAMAAGGMYDHVGGGFHRYSTDESWIIPHFEKMAEDNAWLLRNYLNASLIFNDRQFKDTALGILSFTINVLSDPEGGFYMSQDADVTPDDEGGYFTWTDQDFKRVLNEEEYAVLSQHLLSDNGCMHHDKSKKVLFIVKNRPQLSEITGSSEDDLSKIIESGRAKLLMERNKRETPYIDKTLYTSINGMYISAFFLAYRYLDDPGLRDFAVKSLDKIMKLNYINKELYHTENVKALLDDYVYLADALVSAYEATGSDSYVAQAEELIQLCMNRFLDKDNGGFYDSDDHMLGVKIKGIQDIPHPSSNALVVMLLLRLHSITGNSIYHDHAKKTLQAFSLIAEDLGIHAGYYYSALDAYSNTIKLEVCASPDSDLTSTARSAFAPYLNIRYGEDNGYVTACYKETCGAPFHDGKSLGQYLRSGKYLDSPVKH